MTYSEALRYLESFINYEKVDGYNYKSSLKLDRMRRFSKLLGDPHKATPSIHVAGTKGKGSTAAYIYSILKAAGMKTGLYTSPHLISFRERIRIDDRLISEEDIGRLLDKIRDAVDSSMKDDRPSFFEVYTALAYLYFKEKKVDIAVYETGLGGRLDATNIIEPLVCAITPISYEHTDKLGPTLKEIAKEKCGIIKEGITCVSAPQEKEALNVIEDTCRRKNSKLIVIGRGIMAEEISCDENEEVFNILGLLGEYPLLRSSIIGSHQMINAAVAIGIVESLRHHGIAISGDIIRRGIKDARWEGRLDIVNRRPYVVLDGAQNRASAKALAEAIKKIFRYKKLFLVFGVSKDKDVKGILEELLPMATSVVLTKSKISARALEPAELKKLITAKDAVLTSKVEDAVNLAYSKASPDDLVLVTGSLFVVGEAKENLNKCLQAA